MKTVISVRTDQATKMRAQEVAKEIGIPLSTLLNAYMRQLASTGQVSFAASEPMTPEMEKIIERFQQELKDGEVSPAFSNLDDAFGWLDKQRDDSEK